MTHTKFKCDKHFIKFSVNSENWREDMLKSLTLLRPLRSNIFISSLKSNPSVVIGLFIVTFAMTSLIPSDGISQALNFPTNKAGISIGNSKLFNGLRINFRDRNVDQINGLNITLWQSKQNKDAQVNGISLGILPTAGYLRGINLGVIGIAGEYEVRGLTLGILGAGSGDNLCGLGVGGLGLGAAGEVRGIFLGGLGVGSGSNITGIALGGLGSGAGGNITGVILGGLGAGSGGDITGLAIGGLGAGASGSLNGISLAILGAGAGENITGISLAGLGTGAGRNITGLVFGGLGAGAGEKLTGIAIGGLGAGAPIIEGVAIGGFGSGGSEVQGATLAIGWVKISDGGYLKGFSAAAFNQVKGIQSGISVGIFNYARHLNGIQIGVLNYVKDNPTPFKILPILNAHFD
jgi:hypothetical protein